MTQIPCSNSNNATRPPAKKARSRRNRKKAKASIPNPAPYGNMSILPKEIRSFIYAFVLAGGDMALTRTSRHFYMDTKEALAKHGACHVKINRSKIGHVFHTFIRPPKKHRVKAQNLNLRIKMFGSHASTPDPTEGYPWLRYIFQGLVSCMKGLKSCDITIA